MTGRPPRSMLTVKEDDVYDALEKVPAWHRLTLDEKQDASYRVYQLLDRRRNPVTIEQAATIAVEARLERRRVFGHHTGATPPTTATRNDY